MRTVIQSGRFYFWPIIAANVVSITVAVKGDAITAVGLSVVISCLASAGFLLNDLWDRKIDLVNQAGHFENSDRATIKRGIVSGLMLLLGGLIFAYYLGPLVLCIALGLATALLAYTVVLRKLLLIPTTIAAVVAASPLWAPLMVWRDNTDGWKWLFVIANILILAARELFMDARDQLGDMAGNRDTLATVFGRRITKTAALILSFAGSALFLGVVIADFFRLTATWGFAALSVAGAVIYLVLQPAVVTLGSVTEERTAIQRYVYRSRAAMALMPVVNLMLWRF